MPEFDVITQRSDPAAQRIVDVARPSRGVVRSVLIEDPEPLVQTIRAGVEVVEVYASTSGGVPAEVLAACEAKSVPIRLLAPELLNELFKADKKPKAFGIARVPRPRRLADFDGVRGDIVVLDGVKIVGNIGAIVRTCFALGAAGIVLVDSDLTTTADRRLIRSSRGYVFSLPVVLASRSEAVEYFRAAGTPLVVFDTAGLASVGELRARDERLALILGGEKTGASESFEALADLSVAVPIDPRAESLNVSVCAGIALYERSARNLAARGA